MLAHNQIFVHQNPQILPHRFALKEFFSQAAFMSGIKNSENNMTSWVDFVEWMPLTYYLIPVYYRNNL